VNCYIKHGWDQYLVDPDRGKNCHKKLVSVASKQPDSLSFQLLQAVPPTNDPEWTSQLHKLPKVTYSTIYNFLVDRKVPLKKVSYLESVADENAVASEDSDASKDVKKPNENDSYEAIEYTRTFNKGYRFFRDGHVQEIKYHPMPRKVNYACVRSSVLPSMRKDRIYATKIFFCESTASVVSAYCTCTAGLCGCCNHITATLYYLEEYINMGLCEDELVGCTDRLQAWIKPRKKNVEARPTDDVVLRKMEYGVEKRPKVHRVNTWDCRPVSKRIVDPNRSRRLKRRLSLLEQCKIETADKALLCASSEGEKKKAVQAKSLLCQYGSSCFLQLLDDDAPHSENRMEKQKAERLKLATDQKKKLLDDLSTMQKLLQHDHSYSCSADDASDKSNGSAFEMSMDMRKDLVLRLYKHHVCLSPEACMQVEASTQAQSESDKWNIERKLRITASVMKEVCHRKPSTSCDAFIQKKLVSRPINTPAIRYGQQNETIAVRSYVNHQNKRGINIQVNSCGLYIDPSVPWLAASPDAIVLDPTQQQQNKGCLEVKCPFSCEKVLFEAACKSISGFCLVLNNGEMSLSRTHAYYYQVQTQMHVTRLPWCDFVVWSPIQDVFIERVLYDPAFITPAISKAENFYFNKFLPSALPYFVVTDIKQESACMDPPTGKAVIPPNPPTMKNVESTTVKATIPRKTVPTINPPTMKNVESTTVKAIVPPKTAPVTNSPATTKKAIPPIPKLKKEVLPVVTKKTIPSVMTTKKNPLEEMTGIKITSVIKGSSSTLLSVLQTLSVRKHSVIGDGSCLYHAIAHQAGLISKESRGDNTISMLLRQTASRIMTEHPVVRLEDGLSPLQWLQKKQTILDPAEWGGDLELRLLAIGLKRDIVVITDVHNGSTYARQFPSKPPPIPKMRGGIFVPWTSVELCSQWTSIEPTPLLLIYNGHSHYDSTCVV